MDKTKVKNLYDALKKHRGSFKRIAQRCGYQRQYVRQVLSGEYESLEVLEAALFVLAEMSREAKEREQRIEEMYQTVLAQTA